MTTLPSGGLLPREIIMEKTRDGVRYRLPRRELGLLRWVGLVPVAFGLLLVAVPVVMMWSVFREAMRKPEPMHAFFAAFLLVFVMVAFKPIRFGMIALFGRCAVEITRDWLRVVDSAGPFRKLRRARRADIRRFDMTVGKPGPMPAFLQPLARTGALTAEFDGAKPMPVVVGYPRDWLIALGNALSLRINEVNAVTAQPPLPIVTEVVKEMPSQRQAPLAAGEITLQPESSNARLELNPVGFTLVLPPTGVWRGSRGMLLFSFVWCGFMAVFTCVFLFASGRTSGSDAPFFLFTSLFWAIGIAMLLGAVNMGRRRGLLMADAGTLRMAQESLFGRKSWAWPRDQLAAIRVDRSGMEVNNRPVVELQVHTRDGRKTGVLSGRDELELLWMATMLRQQLGVPADSFGPGN